MKILFAGILGFIFGFIVIYGLWCLIARKRIHLDYSKVFYYMALSFPFCLVLEVGFGNLHYYLFDAYLWEYRVLPVHDKLTSTLNFAIWPLYGLHFYLYDTIEKDLKISPFWKKSSYLLKLAISGPLLEFILNLVCQLAFDRYYFYYFPGDLLHYTSVQVIPYYFVASYAFAVAVKYIDKHADKIIVPVASYLIGLIFLLAG